MKRRVVEKISCDRREHCRMVTFVRQVAHQYSGSKTEFNIQNVATCLTWGFRDRGIRGYLLRVDAELNQVLVIKEKRRLASVKLVVK